LSARATRTVRPTAADCPHPHRGPSGPEPRTVRKSKQNLQRRPRITDHPHGARGLSARHPRTVRQAHADRPELRPTKTQNHRRSKAKPIKNTKNTRRTGTARTVRQVHADRPRGTDRAENCSTPKATPPIHHRISETVEAVETRVWGHEKRQPRMLYPKNFAS
jgi:hypothetical protein